MENETQQNYPPVQSPPQTPPFVPSSTNWSKILLFVILGLVIVAGSIFIGIQIGINQKTDSLSISKQSSTTSLPLPSNTPSEKPVVSNVPTSENTNCIATFTSKYLDLHFKYDNCAWKINEQLSNSNSGNTYYSIITASNSKTLNNLLIKAENIGMGGGYPGCEKVSDIVLLEGNIVRFKTPNNTYLYLNEKNDYAIKGNTGKFGDTKFNEYFTFLNPEAFPNTNMCWRTTGINPVKLLNPNANDEKSKDITLSVKETISDNVFFIAADSLAVSVYSSLTK